MIRSPRHWLSAALFILTTSCASTENEEKAATAKTAAAAKAGKQTKPPAASTPAPAPAAPQDEQRSSGSVHVVTTALSADKGMEGNVPEAVLSQALMTLEEISRKEPNNVPLNVTYMGMLRLYGRNPTLQADVERRAGLAGAKNPWYLIEAAYAALARKEYSMADFLLTKAQKVARDIPQARLSITHANALMHLLEGKTQLGMAEMKTAAQGEMPFLPALLTVGFSELKTGDYKNAERRFRAASGINPNSIMVRLGLAAALRIQGNSADAIPILAPLHKQRPDDRRILWNYCLALADGNTNQQKLALDLLGRLFQIPSGDTPEIDSKANILLTRLQDAQAKAAQPPPEKTPAAPASTPAPAPALAPTPATSGQSGAKEAAPPAGGK
jgi:predicted Zn-dependent protease